MSARDGILQRLRDASISKAPCSSPTTSPAPPAVAILDNVLEHFIDQARKSGVELVCVGSLSEAKAFKTGSPDSTLYVDACVAIAENGTVGLTSQQVASGKIFLCEHLVVRVAESSVVRYLDEALAIEQRNSARALHLITGPSRTADVEQTIQIGAHGPRIETLLIYPDS